MLRQGLIALFMLIVCLGFVAADTLKGSIQKIDEKSVTFAETDKAAKSFDFAADVKFYQEKKGVKTELKDGVKSDAFSKIGKKGINATITTKDDKVTEVILTGKKKAAN